MSFEIENMCAYIQSLVRNKDMDELEEFFETHEDKISIEILNRIFAETCHFHSEFDDFESILCFLLL